MSVQWVKTKTVCSSTSAPQCATKVLMAASCSGKPASLARRRSRRRQRACDVKPRKRSTVPAAGSVVSCGPIVSTTRYVRSLPSLEPRRATGVRGLARLDRKPAETAGGRAAAAAAAADDREPTLGLPLPVTPTST